MSNDNRSTYELRDDILKLLSNAELAKVSTAEIAPSLADGDEYVDLEKLDEGVSRADGEPVPVGRVLTRNSVTAATWSHILSELTKRGFAS